MKKLFIFLSILLIAGLQASLPVNASAAIIRGTLSNFDLYNRSGQSATDVDVILSGVSCSDITYYFGQASHLMNMNCQSVGGGKIRVTFSGGSTFPVAPDASKHFGLMFKAGTQAHVEKIFWTSEGEQIGPYINFVGLKWVGSIECPVGMVEQRSDEPGPSSYVVITEAHYVVSASEISLDNMVPGDPILEALSWQSATSLNGTLTSTTDSLTFSTPAINVPDPSVLARFVALDDGGDTVGIYIEQTVVVRPRGVPALSLPSIALLCLALAAVGVVVLMKRRTRACV